MILRSVINKIGDKSPNNNTSITMKINPMTSVIQLKLLPHYSM